MIRFLLVLAAIILVLYLIFSEVFATAERFKHKAECRQPLAAYMHGGGALQMRGERCTLVLTCRT